MPSISGESGSAMTNMSVSLFEPDNDVPGGKQL